MAVQQRTLVKHDFRFTPMETGELYETFWSLTHSSAAIAKFVRLLRARMSDACVMETSCNAKFTVGVLHDTVLSTLEHYTWYAEADHVMTVQSGLGLRPVSELVDFEEIAPDHLAELVESFHQGTGGLVEDERAVAYNRFLQHLKRLVEFAQACMLEMRFAVTKTDLFVEFFSLDFSDFGVSIAMPLFKP